MRTAAILGLALILCGCAGPGLTGFAGARQQSMSISITFEGDVSPAGAGKDGLVSISTGEMTYDGTRGDLGGTKATTGTGEATASQTVTTGAPKQ
ncbi:MAG: hypothetical protein WCU80_08420 [Paludibacteraceae bacterium]